MLRNGKTKTFWNIFFNIFYFTSYLLVFLTVPLSLQKIKKFSKKLSNFPFVSRDETGVSSLETKVSPLETFLEAVWNLFQLFIKNVFEDFYLFL